MNNITEDIKRSMEDKTDEEQEELAQQLRFETACQAFNVLKYFVEFSSPQIDSDGLIANVLVAILYKFKAGFELLSEQNESGVSGLEASKMMISGLRKLADILETTGFEVEKNKSSVQ